MKIIEDLINNDGNQEICNSLSNENPSISQISCVKENLNDEKKMKKSRIYRECF